MLNLSRMKKVIVTICGLVTAALPLCAQTAQSVKGLVIDEKESPMEFATVAVIALPDSTVVAGGITDESGSFDMEVAENASLVQVSMIGYKTVEMPVSAFSERVTVHMEQDNEMLEGAIVTTQLPRTEIKGDAVVTNIAGSVLEHTGNANDVLAKIPGMISKDGKLEVIGRGEPVYYINGRKITDTSELRDLMSEDIKAIDVVSNPGALYGGDVRCVVRIRTVKRQGEGFGFALTSQAKQHIYDCKDFEPSWSVLDLNYRKGGWDWFGKLVYFNQRGYQYSPCTYSTIIKRDDALVSHSQQGVLDFQSRSVGIQYVFGANWQINENHSLGFKIDRGRDNRHPVTTTVDCDVIVDGKLEDHLFSVSEANSPYSNQWNGNIYYDGKAGKLGINFNGDFVYGHARTDTDTKESSLVDPMELSSTSSAHSILSAGKLVLTYPIGKGELQAGAEETYVVAAQKYSITKTDIPSTDAALSENIIAGFAEYSLPLSFGQFKAGLRYEHLDNSWDDFLLKTSTERHQDNWFPSVSFSTKAGPVDLSFAYTGKTIRPNYGLLTTEISYINRFAYQTGDPFLFNEKHRTASLNANWKWLTFSGSYERTDNLFVQWALPYNDQGVVMVKVANLDVPFRKMSFYLNASPTIGVWSPRFTVGMDKQFLTLPVIDPMAIGGRRDIILNDPMYLFQTDNAFRFKHSWVVEARYHYMSPMSATYSKIYEPIQSLDFSVQKSFLKEDALTLRLACEDVLNSSKIYNEMDFGAYHALQMNDNRLPCITLRVSYRFNSTNSKYKGTGAGQDAKDRL